MLTIYTTPPMVFSASAITDIGPERGAMGGEVPNLSVTLDNADGRWTASFVVPPLRAAAELSEDGYSVFFGAVQHVRLGSAIQIDLEA